MSDLQARLQDAVGDSYRIERELGGGGMSRVFLATELALHRAVVIKILAPELTSEVLAARFKREFEITAVLGQHPHVLPVLSVGTRGGLLYYVTPFIEGESLRHRLRREARLPLDDVVRILSELAGALAFAHEHGIVHRDVKPENILLSDGHAILADFGISAVLSAGGARPAGEDEDVQITDMGMAVGTPGYMSPEQASGEAHLDGRADIYSLAVIGYEMLTGAPPFVGPSPMAVMTAHVNERAKPVETVRTDTPEQLAGALGRAMEKRPEDRFQTAGEFRDALGVSYSGGSRAARPSRRGRFMAGALIATAAAVVAALALDTRVDPAPLQPNLIVVAPFEALGSDLGIWREGLVDVLSSNLDGAGPLRTVPPSVVVRRAPDRLDRQSAAELGRRTHAGITIFGSLISSGPDSVRVSATILETASGRTTEVQYRDERGRMDRVADSLSVAILRELGRTRAIGATRLSAIGSTSLPALKSFLQGEQFYRRSDWDSAASHYRRAVALDSSFAPALRHLSNALGWKLSPQLELSHEGYTFALQAGARNRGLAPRESLLVAADSLFAALMVSGPEVTLAERGPWIDRLTTMLDAGVRRFPDDPEMWYKFGDVHFHFTRFAFPSRSNMSVARDAFDRSIAIDSAFAPAYIHEVDLAASDQDVDALRKSTKSYLALDPQDVHGQSMRVVQTLLDPPGHRTPNIDSIVTGNTREVLQTVFGTLAPLMDSAETQVALARALYRASEAGATVKPFGANAKSAVVGTLLMRGHLNEALTFADSGQYWIFPEVAFMRAISADSAGRVFDRWLSEPKYLQRAAAGAMYWAMTGDTTRLSSFARLVEQKKIPRYPPGMLHGLQALARHDTATAIAAFTLPDSACFGWCWQARFPLAFMLSAKKRDREAAALLDQDFGPGTGVRVLWMLERARVNERLGIRPKAIDAYLFVANAWRGADAVFKPYLDEARAAIERLSPDPGRR